MKLTMRNYQPLTIREALEKINRREILLPMIQRELTWEASDIEKLFDSILSGYPFGTMLFWEYTITDRSAYHFYEFINSYDERPDHAADNHNVLFRPVGLNQTIQAVLDGQQRLTALRIGLTGALTLRRHGAWRTSSRDATNYERKTLFLNLSYQKSSAAEDIAAEYEFKFKTASEVEQDSENLWLPVGRILDIKDIYNWQADLPEFAPYASEIDATIKRLHDVICTYPAITYFPVKDCDMDTALNIFIRINQGGEPLSYTDFLMSVLVNYWPDGREEINKALDDLNASRNFAIDKDVFLRACLFMTGANVNFKVDNFNHDTVVKIEEEFSLITESLDAACSVFNTIGYTKDNLKSTLIFLPLALYMKNRHLKTLDPEDEAAVRKWIQLSILSGAFGGQTNSYLARLQKIVAVANRFPVNKILKVTRDDFRRNFDFSENTIEEMVIKAKKGSQDAFNLLTLLYPGKSYTGEGFDEDHIFPFSKLTPLQRDKSHGGNFLSNLQLLPARFNRANKKAKLPEEWLTAMHTSDPTFDINNYKMENYLFDPETKKPLDLSLDNFEIVMQKRRQNLVSAIYTSLQNL